MTTSPVMSVTDEVVAELEALYLAGWEASGEGWNAEYPGDAHENKSFIESMNESCAPIIAKLLSERAELKRDAASFQWLMRQAWFQSAFERYDPQDDGTQGKFEDECRSIIRSVIQHESKP
ncbi:hypothetical protein KLEP174_gp42 [Pseudomonas phage vB_PcuM_ KLEP17-4]|nr:hypothetical protein KLEP174_gp42 [Pseudomonas phage vB_PcuM_ KLEP17-4]